MHHTWEAVDRYFEAATGASDAVLSAALGAAAAAGLPPIHVSPLQGRLLTMLAQLRAATSILEVGTLAAYSTICLARGMAPQGRLTTLELDPRHACVARSNLATAGLLDRVTLIEGPALDAMRTLHARGHRIDLAFIDADKAGIPEYFDLAVRMALPGAVLIVDNVVRDGKVLDASGEDPSVEGVRRFAASLASDRRVMCTTLQTVGVKGYDGFTIALVA
ncbi:MAG: O-methyltransferase [Phycisphaerales bacterium]|nr:O-methyltransferase [Phycisphaerales bacterium]